MNARSLPESRPRSARARRNARLSGDERERAILRATEGLLEQRPLAQVSVEEIARGAGLSRPAFYFYFPSKDAVVLSLMERMIAEADAALEQDLRLRSDAAAQRWRQSIAMFFEIFGAHRAVIAAATELSASNEEARELWARTMQGWVEHVAKRIEEERARGSAPEGPAARDLATALVQMNERALGAVYTGAPPAICEDAAIETLAHVWVSAIYGAPASAVS